MKYLILYILACAAFLLWRRKRHLPMFIMEDAVQPPTNGVRREMWSLRYYGGDYHRQSFAGSVRTGEFGPGVELIPSPARNVTLPEAAGVQTSSHSCRGA